VPRCRAARRVLDRTHFVEGDRGHGQDLRGPGGRGVGAAGLAVPGGALVAGEIVMEEGRAEEDGEIEDEDGVSTETIALRAHGGQFASPPAILARGPGSQAVRSSASPSSFFICSRIRYFCTLPVTVRGKHSTSFT
jgi:hypothetical protein